MIQSSNERLFYFSVNSAKYFSILFALAIIPLSAILPASISWENGPLEDFQVLLLFSGCLISLYFYKQAPHSRFRKMWLTTSGLFLLLTGRELSWGRVFFQTKLTTHGPEFLSMSHIPHHMIINILLGCLILAVLAGTIFSVPWGKLFFDIPWPTSFIFLLFLGALLSTIGDHSWIFPSDQGENMEELGEILMYSLLLHLTLYYHYWLKKLDRN